MSHATIHTDWHYPIKTRRALRGAHARIFGNDSPYQEEEGGGSFEGLTAFAEDMEGMRPFLSSSEVDEQLGVIVAEQEKFMYRMPVWEMVAKFALGKQGDGTTFQASEITATGRYIRYMILCFEQWEEYERLELAFSQSLETLFGIKGVLVYAPEKVNVHGLSLANTMTLRAFFEKRKPTDFGLLLVDTIKALDQLIAEKTQNT